jgi:hypothetical protein
VGAARDDVTVRIELGQRGLATPNPVSEETQVAGIKRRLALDEWPAGPVEAAAVDVSDSGRRTAARSPGACCQSLL